MKRSISEEKYKDFSKQRRLSYVHCIILIFSLAITLIAFSFSSNQVFEKEEKEFLREFEKVNALISERMGKYEDGLTGGVSCIQSHGGTISYTQWLTFFNNLKIDKKYPGINGIGLIANVKEDEIPEFTEKMKKDFPNFEVYPDHNEKEYWPIVFIEPLKENFKALGLDMSHENNRFAALKKSCELKEPQITGPITLVQDEGRTSGFLFFSPYYDELGKVLGIVYAPFVVDKFMNGTLNQYDLHVTISIADDGVNIYSEHDNDFMNPDPDPLYSKKKVINMYGRNWIVDVRSNASFRENSNEKLPIIILFSGVVIDIMLLTVFLTLTKSNKNAFNLANRMSKELNIKN